jgi:hypothetical protein
MTSIARGLLIAAMFTGLAACGDEEPKASAPSATVEGQATWLGTGGPCEELARVEADKDAKENLGQVFCGNAGKTFTGEMRCARDFIEVSCR